MRRIRVMVFEIKVIFILPLRRRKKATESSLVRLKKGESEDVYS